MAVSDRKSIARKSIFEALRTRQRVGHGLSEAICPYDLAESLGVEVRFLDIPSMEGMYYSSATPHIIISSLRPPGRRSFTCAHELGHHVSGDGTHMDEFATGLKRTGRDSKEFAADCFAGALLMPKLAVERAFAVRKWSPHNCTPGQVFVVAGYFGVGYVTLIEHMKSSLSLLSPAHATGLLKTKPIRAQSMALGWETSLRAWIVDRHWTGRPADVEVDDLICVPGKPVVEGSCVEQAGSGVGTALLRARRPGIARLEDSTGWATFVRVSRRTFVGRNLHRHHEDADEE